MESVWSEDLEDKLIDLRQQYECLCQITAGSYHDRQKKRNAVHIAESVGSRRELVANSCTHRRRDKTVSSPRRCVLGLSLMCTVKSQPAYSELMALVVLSCRRQTVPLCVLTVMFQQCTLLTM